jgi:hypothetical protein
MQGDWYAESLRLTFFVPADWVQRSIFFEITGSQAAEQVVRPPVHLHQEIGNALGALFTVSQQPGRIDLVLSDTPTLASGMAAQAPKAFYWAGPLKDCTEAFDRVIAAAVPIVAANALRVAYAITPLKQTETASGAMEVLKDALPTVDFDPQSDTDFVYQINRPRVSRFGYKLNRLARWEVIQSSILNITVGVPATIPMVEAFAARIYADISTDEKNTKPIPAITLAEVVDEVRAIALEIVDKGDRK